MRLALARKRAYGGLSPVTSTILCGDGYVRRYQSGDRQDLRQLTLSCRTEVTTGVAARLSEFDKPALIAWSADDVFFELGDGERLAATLPNARLEVIERARTFSMVDRPDQLADLISTIAVRA